MILFILTCYQKIISPALKQLLGISCMCRFTPSCSEYAKVSIKQYGSIRGLFMTVVRLLHCQPFGAKEFLV